MAERLAFGGPFCGHHGCPCAVAGPVCEEPMIAGDRDEFSEYCHRCGWTAAAHTEPNRGPMTDHDYNTFLCRCSQEGRDEADAVVEEVLQRLSGGSPELRKHDVSKETLLTNVVVSLQWDFNARITGIFCDQWSAVSAESYDGTFATWMQCDQVEDGIAATWKAFADRAEAEKAP